jgi:uroporphyrinogen decarboxylase
MDPVERMRRMFEGGPVDHLVRRPFGYFPQTYARWEREGAPADVLSGGTPGPRFGEFFGFDPEVWMPQCLDLGWCEAPVVPAYEEKVLRVEDGHEIVQDGVGRVKVYPIGVREQVMPTYLKHAVATRQDWERDVRPRLDPATPARWTGYEERAARDRARLAQGEGLHTANVVGGYMYMRSLVGPTDLLYLFYDAPDLVHSMMRAWRDLMVTCLGRVQRDVGPFFRLFLAEDICYKSGPLISPAMMREFLMPYYREVFETLRAGQPGALHFEIDTDGYCLPVVDVYREVGVTAMSPWEVASDCDVVEAGRRWPDLMLSGGIDKRVLAAGPRGIDRMLERILPPMVARGRYIPTCDHAVPEDVSLENYLHFRRRVMELDHA